MTDEEFLIAFRAKIAKELEDLYAEIEEVAANEGWLKESPIHRMKYVELALEKTSNNITNSHWVHWFIPYQRDWIVTATMPARFPFGKPIESTPKVMGMRSFAERLDKDAGLFRAAYVDSQLLDMVLLFSTKPRTLKVNTPNFKVTYTTECKNE